MGLSRGIIKLSHYQAEGKRSEFAALCFKYIVCTVTSVAIFVLWLRNYGNSNALALILASAVAVVLSIYFRTSLHYRMYGLSACYLRRKCDISLIKPTGVQLFGCGITLLALKCTVVLLMLSPAITCFYFGMRSFSMSGNRTLFMLMLGASICMIPSGIIFAAMILVHFDCAEYLFFSGECNSIFSALDTSWLIMEDNCGDGILLRFSLIARGIPICALSRINLAAKLTQVYLDKRHSAELYCELCQDQYGRQSVDLIILQQ